MILNMQQELELKYKQEMAELDYLERIASMLLSTSDILEAWQNNLLVEIGSQTSENANYLNGKLDLLRKFIKATKTNFTIEREKIKYKYFVQDEQIKE